MPVTLSDAVAYALAKCQRHFGLYTEAVHRWPAMAHHKPWHEVLTSGQPRAIIIAPPASAKTTHVGIAYSAHSIGNDPNIHIGYVTNSADLAEDRSVAVRNTIAENDLFRAVFPGVQPDTKRGWGQAEWFVKRDNSSDPHPTFRAVGIEGSIIGYRIDLLIADDICTPENMATAHQREMVYRNFTAKLLTRLTPEGRVIVIMTRWHHDDLAARLIAQGWPVLHTPALDSDGNSYWPDFWPTAKLHGIKAEIGSREFESQYQGNPTAEVGNILQWFPTYEKVPKLRLKIHRWDTAWSERQTADYSAMVSLGLGEDNNVYVLSGWRDRLDIPELALAVQALAEREKPNMIVLEQAARAEEVVKAVKRATMLPIVAEPVKARMDKVARVNAAAPTFEAGRVLFPARWHHNYGPWVEDLIEECKQFPQGKHDDMVDALVGGVLRLIQSWPSVLPIPARFG